jgi:uncharacterized protein (TIGR03067 family)
MKVQFKGAFPWRTVMFTRIACLLLALPLLGVAPPSDAKKGPAELQGAWRLVSVDTEGEPANLPDPEPVLVIEGERVLYGGEAIARISTDATTSPKVIDMRFNNPERIYEGVYAAKNDSLKVCLNAYTEGVKERPDAFSVKEHPAWRLLSFERVKPEEAGTGTGFVGLSLRFDEKHKVVIVNAALDGSPAKKVGLCKDDILLEVGGVRVADLPSALKAVRAAKPRTELALRIRRDGKEHEATVKVGLLPFTLLTRLE